VMLSAPVASSRALPFMLESGGDSIWYYVHRSRVISVFNRGSATRVGWMGPSGYVAGDATPRPFSGAFVGVAGNLSGTLLAFHDTVYRVDVRLRQIAVLYAAAPGDTVVAIGETPPSAAMGTAAGRAAQFSVIATLHKLTVFGTGDSLRFSVPFDARGATYEVELNHAFGGGADRYVMITWVRGRGQVATQLAPNGDRLAEFALPADTSHTGVAWTAPSLTALVTPLAMRVGERLLIPQIASRMSGSAENASPPTREERALTIVTWTLAVLSALACAAFINWRGRAYAFPEGRLWVWTVLGFLFGPLAIAVIFSLLEWPAREACPSCRRLRVVTREHCEHCGAPFAAPAPDGTEIFATVGA